MKAKMLSFLMLVALTCPALSQAAQPRPGGYMSAFIGASIPQDTTVDSDIFSTNSFFSDRVSLDPGINLGMTVGYDSGLVRLEGELSYKYNEIKDITDQSDNYQFRNVDGNIGALAIMFNGFFDMHNNSPITPYLGGGIGMATLYLNDTYGTDTRGVSAVRTHLYVDDYASVFAYQVGGGVEIALNPNLSLDLGYRYFGTTEAKLDNYWDQSVRFKYESHNATAGLRLKF